MLVISFVTLQSFQSCSQESVNVRIENYSQDTIFCTVRPSDSYHNRTGYSWDVFDGGRSSFEWKEIAPKETSSDFFDMYFEDKESVSWKVWCIKKKEMADMTLEEVIDNNLLDSLCSMIRVYTYDDLKSMNFCIRVY